MNTNEYDVKTLKEKLHKLIDEIDSIDVLAYFYTFISEKLKKR